MVRWFLLPVLVLGLLSTLAVSGHAAPLAAEGISARTAEEIRRHHESANQLFTRKKYAEALQELVLAYRLGRDPSLLANQGRVLERMEQLPLAALRYQQSLDSLLQKRPVGWDESKVGEVRRSAEGQLQALEPRLLATYGRLKVTTVPERVEVRVAALSPEELATPLDLWLEPGVHRVELSLEGYCPRALDATMLRGKTTTETATLDPSTFGRLTLEAEPDLRVRLDGKPVGVTPLERQLVPVGQHELVLTRGEEQVYKKTLAVESCKTVVLKPKVTAAPRADAAKAAPVASALPLTTPEPDYTQIAVAGGVGALAVGAGVAAVLLFMEGGDRQQQSREDEGALASCAAICTGTCLATPACAGCTKEDIARRNKEIASLYDEGKSRILWGSVAAGVGTVALGSAIWLLVDALHPAPVSAPPTKPLGGLSLLPTLSGFAVTVPF